MHQKMCTDCAIETYREIAPEIFKRNIGRRIGSKFSNPIIGRPWYKAASFEKAVRAVIQQCSREPKTHPDTELEDVHDSMLISSNLEGSVATCKMYEHSDWFPCLIVTNTDYSQVCMCSETRQ